VTFNSLITNDSTFVYAGDNKTYTSKLVLPIDASNGSVSSYNDTIKNVFSPFSTTEDFNKLPFRRVYMILSNDVIDAKKYETFKKALIGNIVGNTGIIGTNMNGDIEKQFDAYWLTQAKPQFTTENNITTDFINNLEKGELKKYVVYVPFNKVERVLNYTTDTSNENANTKNAQETLIKGLGASTNQNTKKTTWNDKIGDVYGTYVSKAKLN